MKTRLSLFLTLITALFIFAQDDYICWDKNYGGPFDDAANCIVQTSDGGYAVAGSYMYQIGEDWFSSHAHIYKLDALGEIEWENPFLNIGASSSILDIIETSDGNMVVFTNIQYAKNKIRQYGVLLMKLDPFGELIWEKFYTHGETMSARAITETPDDGLAICGECDLNDSVRVGIVMKYDQNGDSLWTTELRNDEFTTMTAGYLLSIQANSTGELFTGGYNNDEYGSDSWLIGLDVNGGELFNVDYGDSTVGDAFESIAINNETQNIYAAGMKGIDTKFHTDATIYKFNFNGDSLWTRTYGFNSVESWEWPQYISTTNDNGCIITGYTRYEFDNEMFLMKLDDNGDSLWTRRYGSPFNNGDSKGTSVKQTDDGGYITCGINIYNVEETDQMWVMKLDPDGLVTSIEDSDNIITDFELRQNYPNPFNNQTNIQYTIRNATEVELNVYNIKGEFVKNLVDEKRNKGKHSISFQADNLNSGIYYYQLKINGIVKDTKRMVYLK